MKFRSENDFLTSFIVLHNFESCTVSVKYGQRLLRLKICKIFSSALDSDVKNLDSLDVYNFTSTSSRNIFALKSVRNFLVFYFKKTLLPADLLPKIFSYLPQ